ncbi:hypothetical protein SNEBB_006526 [Seison nebaliae]|nr:hypothetical protein SNEBB_006526 [Seison nebaliae]
MFFIPFCRGMTKAYAIEVTTAVNRKYRPPCFALSWTWDGPGTWNKVRVRLFDVLDSKTDWVPVKHLVKGATTTVVVKDLLKELSHIQISYQRPDSKLLDDTLMFLILILIASVLRFISTLTKSYTVEVTTANNDNYRPSCGLISDLFDGPGTWNQISVRLYDVLGSHTEWIPIRELHRGHTSSVVIKDILRDLDHIEISYRRPRSFFYFWKRCDLWKLQRIIVRDLIDHKSYVTKCNCWFDRQHHVVDRKLHEFTPKVDSVDNTYEGEDESGLSSILSWAGK